MLRSPLVVLAAVTLLLAQVECAAACTSELCTSPARASQSAPPCHRHHGQSQSGTPDQCPHSPILTAAAFPQVSQADWRPPVAVGPSAPTETPAIGAAGVEMPDLAASPPGIRSLAPVVLRI